MSGFIPQLGPMMWLSFVFVSMLVVMLMVIAGKGSLDEDVKNEMGMIWSVKW